MEPVVAPELNGKRITVEGSPSVWLVYHGMRHHIDSPKAYEALFAGTDGIVPLADIEAIMSGPDLTEDVCLVRADGDHRIFLVTGFPDAEIRKFLIPSFEIFTDFAFDKTKVRGIPALAAEAIVRGRDLASSTDQRGLP